MRDAEGAPVPGANVTLIDRRGEQAGLTAADQDGHYTLTAPTEGSYVLAGSATGYTPRACPVAYDGGGLTVETDLVLTAHSPARRGAMLS
ncbi:carboxypeptidase-like regulatory domain-containing protein [Streptomyces sp. NPDC002730]|uniref:carboxypeptidase-like regulatory domain-containing protein n=1 Tax=Streptomyces sp. NPDC002730 TaxID=3364662 RepID=UPI0036956894